MKILLFGRGVIATVYGWALERAGHDEMGQDVRPSDDLLDVQEALGGADGVVDGRLGLTRDS